jgi:hypothetical protein
VLQVSDRKPLKMGLTKKRFVAVLILMSTVTLLALSTVSIIKDSESRQFPEGTSIHEGFPWRNGDHMYYVSSALQIAGVPYEQALRDTTNEFNDWPGEPNDLNLGYLSMDFSPLVYPRFTFPLFLSWGYQAIGFLGMFTVPLLLFSLTTGFLIYWVRKTFGLYPAIGALLSCASSVLFIKYGSGLFIESVVFLLQVSWLFLLPISTTSKQSIQKIFLFNLTVALLAVTRQMPLLPLLVLLAGFLSASVIQRTLKNQWLPFLLSGFFTTLTMYLLVSYWAPYDPIPYLTSVYGAPTGAAFIPWALNHLLDALVVTGTSLNVKDPAMFILIPLGLLGGWYLRKKTITWIAVGAWLASSSTLALNLPEYRFWAPGIVFSMPLIGYGAAIAATMLKRFFVRFKDQSPQVFQDGQDWSISAKASNWLLISIFALSIATGTSLGFRYNAEELTNFVEPVSTYGWTDATGRPLNGFVHCQGRDSQLVYVSQSEQTFPITGTAKARSFGQPELIAFNSDGRKVDYASLQQLMLKCLSSNSIADN